MTIHTFTFKPDYRPTTHPSGIVYLRTGLTRAYCICGASFMLPPMEEPQRTIPGRKGVLTVQRACA